MEQNDTNDFSDLTSMDHENLPEQDKSYNKPGPKPKELVEGTFQGLPVGRDKKVIDPDDVQKLAALGCKDREIANFLGIKQDTLRYNFSDNLLVGREQLKMTLRRAMLKNACEHNNAAVQIFLAKNILGMSDTPTDSEDSKPLPWDSVE
jgi:DNA-binding CsgD family transcriptional regulator